MCDSSSEINHPDQIAGLKHIFCPSNVCKSGPTLSKFLICETKWRRQERGGEALIFKEAVERTLAVKRL